MGSPDLQLQIVVNFHVGAKNQTQVVCKSHLSSPPYRIFETIELQDVGSREEFRTLGMLFMGIASLSASLSVCLFLGGMRHQTLLTGAPGCVLYRLRTNGVHELTTA